MGLDTTTFDNALKTYYTDDRVEELQSRDRPFMALVKKSEKFGGKAGGMPIPIVYADPQAVSTSFATSQSRAANANTAVANFNLTRALLYNTLNISTEVMDASEGDEAAWLDARTTEINDGIEAVSNRIAQALYRSGWGDLGTVGAISGSTITLGSTSDASGIEKGQVHTFSLTLASNVLRGSTQSLTVVGVNRNTGVITYNAAVSTITGGGGSVAVGDTVFTAGDRQDSATPTMLMPAGLEGWCPAGGPTSTLWFGQDRTIDSRLGGVSYDGSSGAPEDGVIEIANRMAELGRTPTHCFTSYRQFSKIVKSQRLLERFNDKMTATVGFQGVILLGSKGPIKLIPDQFCPNTRAFLLDMSVVKLHSMKKAVHIIENDNNMVLRQAAADGIEVRIGFKGNLGCGAPSGIGNLQLTAV